MADFQNWEVFLSFRGEDTRLNFTDHLYSALNSLGIRTFRDDEGLEKGREIGDSLRKAIEESKVSIVVFSQNYADSKWCLNELDKIMRCRREKGQIVLPVFYHVNPSDVRKRRGSFGDALARYGYYVSGERLMRWTAALAEAGGLSGWHLQDHGCESEIIARIVNDVCNKLNPRQHFDVDTSLEEMDSRLGELLSVLRMEESNDIRIIGICGVGGIGKTTLAEAIYNQIAHQFEEVFFFGYAAGRENTWASSGSLERLLADILGEEFVRSMSNIYEAMTFMRQRLCYRKVLVILDDVEGLNRLEFLAGRHQCFGAGSRIIVTTCRDRSLLSTCGVDDDADEPYEVRELKYEESFQLYFFPLQAFGPNFPDQELFLYLSGWVANHCGGLPLAIKVLRGLLHG